MRTLALALLPLIAAAAPEPAALPEWLAGAWCTEGAAEVTCERWGPAAGGMMLGTSQTVRDGGTAGFEFLRVALDGGVPVYLAQPGGKPAVAFRASAGEGQAITFRNTGHDYPQRIRYWREGDTLNAEIAMADGSNAMQWRYRRVAR